VNVAPHAHPEHATGEPLNIISLCTGGGGLDLGVELACPDARVVCMVEGEAFAVARLVAAMQAGLLAHAPVWSDAATFNGRPWRGGVDGVIGGIPCQPHSLAGKRLGAGDARDLWSAARRIIVQSGAWFVLIENVPGMLSASGGEIPGAQRVWRDLHRLGFAVEGGLFTAEEVGASHKRERLFILAVHDGRMADAARFGRGEGRAEPEIWRGRCPADGGGGALENASCFAGRLHPRQGRCDGGTPDAGGRSQDLADTVGGESVQRHEANPLGGRARQTEQIGLGRSGTVDTECSRRTAAVGGLDVDTGREPEPGCSDVVDAVGGGHHRRPVEPLGRALGRVADERPSATGDPTGDDGAAPLFPPGPADVDAWSRVLARTPERAPSVSDADAAQNAGLAEIARVGGARHGAETQSAFRGLADGLATRMDELRLLGNGVVSLEAAYAWRTLVARHATAGCAGAARLV